MSGPMSDRWAVRSRKTLVIECPCSVSAMLQKSPCQYFRSALNASWRTRYCSSYVPMRLRASAKSTGIRLKVARLVHINPSRAVPAEIDRSLLGARWGREGEATNKDRVEGNPTQGTAGSVLNLNCQIRSLRRGWGVRRGVD